MIEGLGLDQIAAMDSAWFPPISMIYAQKPKFPVRIYASEHHKLAICISEFTMPASLDRFIAKSILTWSKQERCKLVISPCSVPLLDEAKTPRQGVLVQRVGSTERTRRLLKESAVVQLEFGVIPGISGAPLNEGKWDSFDVIALIAEAYSEIPDARDAAAMVETIDKLLPQINLDVRPLYAEAGKIESRLKTLREQAKPAQSSIRPTPYA